MSAIILAVLGSIVITRMAIEEDRIIIVILIIN